MRECSRKCRHFSECQAAVRQSHERGELIPVFCEKGHPSTVAKPYGQAWRRLEEMLQVGQRITVTEFSIANGFNREEVRNALRAAEKRGRAVIVDTLRLGGRPAHVYEWLG